MKKIKKILNQKGVSLIEIMTAVVIIGILTAIAIPNYQKYQRKARQVEPKLIMGGIYTSSIAFNSEWGYSTSNFIQLGFSPSGDIQYKTGFNNALVTKNPGNWVAGTTLPANLSDYDGPPVPDNASKTRIETEDFCNNSNDCTYLSTGTSLTIPAEAKIDNTNKFTPKFIIMAVGNLGGAQEDHWEMGIGQVAPNKPTGKYMINIKDGL